MKVPTYTSMNGEPVSLTVKKGCGSFREDAKISHFEALVTSNSPPGGLARQMHSDAGMDGPP